jgi:hypothetical protein
MCATLKGISHREVLNAASREANGIKMLQRTRDSSQKQFPAASRFWSSMPTGSKSTKLHCRLMQNATR